MEKLVVIDGNFWLFSCYYATAAMGNLMGRLLEVSYWKNIKGQESQHRMNLFVSFRWLENI